MRDTMWYIISEHHWYHLYPSTRFVYGRAHCQGIRIWGKGLNMNGDDRVATFEFYHLNTHQPRCDTSFLFYPIGIDIDGWNLVLGQCEIHESQYESINHSDPNPGNLTKLLVVD